MTRNARTAGSSTTVDDSAPMGTEECSAPCAAAVPCLAPTYKPPRTNSAPSVLGCSPAAAVLQRSLDDLSLIKLEKPHLAGPDRLSTAQLHPITKPSASCQARSRLAGGLDSITASLRCNKGVMGAHGCAAGPTRLKRLKGTAHHGA